jgi:hypothetical protein
MTKKDGMKYGLLPTKIAQSDTVSLGQGLCEFGESIPFTIMTPAKMIID